MLCDTCNIYDVGCKNSCGNIVFGNFLPGAAGVYSAQYDISGARHTVPFTIIDASDPIVLDAGLLPVGRDILISIMDDGGEIVTFEIEDVIYTQIKIKLIPGLMSEPAGSGSTESGKWEEVIEGTGSDTYTAEKPLYSFDLIQVARDGVVLRKDQNLTEANTYKFQSGSIVLAYPLEQESYLHIIKM